MPLKLPALDPVAHLYGDTGTFTVTLIVSNKGCLDTLIQPKIEKILPPKPVFSFKLNCINPYSVKFTDASEGADSLSWDLGDGTIIADSLSITHIYAARGPKTITLTAFNFKTGCSFSMTNSFTGNIHQYIAGCKYRDMAIGRRKPRYNNNCGANTYLRFTRIKNLKTGDHRCKWL